MRPLAKPRRFHDDEGFRAVRVITREGGVFETRTGNSILRYSLMKQSILLGWLCPRWRVLFN